MKTQTNLAVVAAALLLTACGGGGEAAVSAAPPPAGHPAPAPAPVPTPEPAPAPTAVAPPLQHYSAQLDCAYRSPRGEAVPHTVTFNSGRLTVSGTGGPTRSTVAAGAFTKTQHTSAATYTAASTGGDAGRFWMVIHNAGSLLAGGFNGTTPTNDVWCGSSIPSAPKAPFYRVRHESALGWHTASVPVQCEAEHYSPAGFGSVTFPGNLQLIAGGAATVVWSPSDVTLISGTLQYYATRESAPIMSDSVPLAASPYESNKCESGACKTADYLGGHGETSVTADERTGNLIRVHSSVGGNSGSVLRCTPR